MIFPKTTLYVSLPEDEMSRVTLEGAAAGLLVKIESTKTTTPEDQELVREAICQWLEEHHPEMRFSSRVPVSSNPDIRRQEMAAMLVSAN